MKKHVVPPEPTTSPQFSSRDVPIEPFAVIMNGSSAFDALLTFENLFESSRRAAQIEFTSDSERFFKRTKKIVLKRPPEQRHRQPPVTDEEYSIEASRRFAQRMRCIRLAARHESEKPKDDRVPTRKKRTPTLKPVHQGK